jgi:hypothetical protein
MGFSNSIIAIKGEYLNRSDEIFRIFNYIDNKKDQTFYNWDQASEYLFTNYIEFANKEIALRGIWIDKGWTLVCDPELVDPTEEDKLIVLSKLLNTEVWTFLIQTTSASYSFAKYDLAKKRSFFVSKGKVVDNTGNPLAQEKGYNINENFCVGEISSIGKSLGININPDSRLDYVVKELGYDDELKGQLANFLK